MRMPQRSALGALAAAAVTSLVIGTATPAHAAKTYANCTAMHKVYKHGVAKSGTAANKQVRAGYGRPAVKPKVYAANTKSDRDKDGTACEA
jgi:hypothetical protein